MIERRVVTVSLTPELHAFVRALVSSGRYGSVSEVTRAGLRLLQREEAAQGHAAPAAMERSDG